LSAKPRPWANFLENKGLFPGSNEENALAGQSKPPKLLPLWAIVTISLRGLIYVEFHHCVFLRLFNGAEHTALYV